MIVQGDCIELMAALEPNSVDMIFTDPPYGHNNNDGKDLIGRIGLFRGKEYEQGATSDGRPIANDGKEANDLFAAFLAQAKRVLKSDGCCCCCCCGGGGGPDPQFARWSLMMDAALTFKHMIVWDKGPMGMGWHYRRSYETVLVAHRGQKCRWYDESDRIENVIRPSHGIPKVIPSASQHPTEKPWKLAAWFISLHTKPGDLVLDPFAGSGSTGEAAIRLDRKFLGFEIDPAFAAMAARRLEDTTPSLFSEAV